VFYIFIHYPLLFKSYIIKCDVYIFGFGSEMRFELVFVRLSLELSLYLMLNIPIRSVYDRCCSVSIIV